MKLNTQAFPYPVLTSDIGDAADYNDSDFQCSLLFNKEVTDEQKFDIEYNFQLSNDAILSLIESGSASYSIHLYCADTLKREMFRLEKVGTLTLDASDLYGKFELTPMVVVKKKVTNFTSEDLNEEFGSTTFELSMGDIIAIDDTLIKYIEFNSQSFDSLVKTSVDKDLEDPFSYVIDPTPSIIRIRLGTEMHKLYKELQSKQHKGILGMSLFKDIVYLAIDDLIRDPEEAESQLWARSFRSKIESLGLELPKEKQRDFNEINLLAQKFVKEIGVEKLFKVLKLGAS